MDFVKKLSFGIALMALGTLGVTALLFGVLLTEPVSYNGFNGWLGSFLYWGLTGPFLLFLAAALAGLVFALWGVFEKKD